MNLDMQTILSTLIAGLLLAIIIGGFVMRDTLTKLAAEFRAFRFEVLRYMESHQGDD